MPIGDLARKAAQTARVAGINELKALLVTAPVDLRDQIRSLGTAALVTKCQRFRIAPTPVNEHTATKQALRSLARRIRALNTEIADLRTSIAESIDIVAPQLLQELGVGPVTATQVYIAWSHPRRCRNKAAFARLAAQASRTPKAGRPGIGG